MKEKRKVWLARTGKEGPEVLEGVLTTDGNGRPVVRIDGRRIRVVIGVVGLPIYKDWSFGWTEEEAYAKEVARLKAASDEAFDRFVKTGATLRQLEEWGWVRYVEKRQ